MKTNHSPGGIKAIMQIKTYHCDKCAQDFHNGYYRNLSDFYNNHFKNCLGPEVIYIE